MNARQILTQAIRTYNIDHFDEEQKHLHVTLKEEEFPLFKGLTMNIPNHATQFIKHYAKEGADERAYEDILMTFIHYSLNNLTK